MTGNALGGSVPVPGGGSAIAIGDVVAAAFPSHDPAGHEQEGYRPAVVVGIPQRVGKPRYAVLVVVPVTTYRSQGWADASPALYPRIPPGTGGLRSESVCLLDQVRCVGTPRVRRRLGSLAPGRYRALEDGLRDILGMDTSPGGQTR